MSVFAEAVPWSNVAMAAVFVFGFVAFCWVVTRHGGSLLDVEFHPKDRKPPEWRYERGRVPEGEPPPPPRTKEKPPLPPPSGTEPT